MFPGLRGFLGRRQVLPSSVFYQANSPVVAVLPFVGERIAGAQSAPHSPLCRINTNAMPLVVSAGHPATGRIVPANVLPDAAGNARRLRNEPGSPIGWSEHRG
jgi:hypothetical protein